MLPVIDRNASGNGLTDFFRDVGYRAEPVQCGPTIAISLRCDLGGENSLSISRNVTDTDLNWK
jgi:hypothetical protein